jgi:hypothetical protein
MTFLAALRHDRIDAPFLLDGPINKGNRRGGDIWRVAVAP